MFASYVNSQAITNAFSILHFITPGSVDAVIEISPAMPNNLIQSNLTEWVRLPGLSNIIFICASYRTRLRDLSLASIQHLYTLLISQFSELTPITMYPSQKCFTTTHNLISQEIDPKQAYYSSITWNIIDLSFPRHRTLEKFRNCKNQSQNTYKQSPRAKRWLLFTINTNDQS